MLLKSLTALTVFALISSLQNTAFANEWVDLLHDTNFFENSARRDLTEEEEKIIVRAVKKGRTGGCTGFFVANTKDKFLLATARHCYNYKINEACSSDQIRVLPSGKMHGRFVGSCQKVAVASEKDDIAIVELNILDTNEQPASQELLQEVKQFYTRLNLAAYEAPVWFRLKMLGYPSDEGRKSQATVSENCWMMPENSKIAVQAIPEADRDQRFKDWQRNRPQDTEEQRQINAKLKMKLRKYNCSVYGGNSGGPILMSNTLDFIGMPRTYYPGLYNTIPKTYSHNLEETVGFIQNNQQAILDNGIVLSFVPSWILPDFNYLRRFQTQTKYAPRQIGTECLLKLSVERSSGLLEVENVSHVPGSCSREGSKSAWKCHSGEQKFCAYGKGNDYWVIENITAESFDIRGTNGFKETYTAIRPSI